MPVMIPGRASGRTSSRHTTSRPKNGMRCTAKAAQDPRTSAMAVAARPALQRQRPAQPGRLSSCQATENQCVVRPWIGQLWMFERLNA